MSKYLSFLFPGQCAEFMLTFDLLVRPTHSGSRSLSYFNRI